MTRKDPMGNMNPGWQPVTPNSPPEFHDVYLYRAGDLDPAVGCRVEDAGEMLWLRVDAGAEDGDHQEYGSIGESGWAPTHYREIEEDLPGRREAQAEVAAHVKRVITDAIRKAEKGGAK